MAGPPPLPDEREDSDDWLITYADAITLLMAFFIMLLTFSKIDIPTFEEIAAGIKNEIGKRDVASPISLLSLALQDKVYEMQADQAVDVEKDDKGVTIELASSAFYEPGAAKIRDRAIPVLKTIAEKLLSFDYRFYNVEVEGHTDDVPIRTSLYPSNWELSAARATRVARFFIDLGMASRRLKAVGFADTRPKLPNRDAEGNPIKENQAENRRVVIRVYPMDLDEQDALVAAEEEARRLQRLHDQAANRPTNGPTPTADPAPANPAPANPAPVNPAPVNPAPPPSPTR